MEFQYLLCSSLHNFSLIDSIYFIIEKKNNRYICNVKSELKKEKRENTLDVKSILIYVHPVIPRRESGSKFRSHNL